MATISEFNEPCASVAAYDAAQDNEVELLENPQLQNGVAGAGAYNYNGQAYTVGYGYDVSRQLGVNIVSDLNAALSNVGGLAHFLTPSQINQVASYVPNGSGITSLATLNSILLTGFNGGALNLTQSQAAALLDAVVPRYELQLENYLTTNADGSTVAQSLGNTRALLFSELYNGVFGPLRSRLYLTTILVC